MQVIETLSQGLKREFKVVLTTSDLETRLQDGLNGIKDRVRINGFRPGKVPPGHLRKLYGRSIMGDVLQNAVNEANQKIATDNALRFALEPKVSFPEDQATLEAAMDAKGDLAFTVAVEILPKIDLADHSDIALTRQVAEVPDADVDAALERMAGQNRTYTSKGGDGAAVAGDKVVIDFVGTINGTPFEGGTAQGIDLVLGSNSFIPGFEAQLEGIKAGEQRTVAVTFPENYMSETLAGQAAEFAVTATDVQAPDAVVINDEMAKAFGMDGLDALKTAIRGQLQREMDTQSRRKLKKALLDALDSKYSFDLPEVLLEQEFQNVWAQLQADMKQSGRSFADEGTTEEAAAAEYRLIAGRRVRLGLVLAEIGDQAKVQIADEEVTQALVARAREFPGQEKQVWEYYRKNPQALAELRAPIFEEKVVDHLLSQVSVTDLAVTREQLYAEDDATPSPEAAAVAAGASEATSEATPAAKPRKKKAE